MNILIIDNSIGTTGALNAILESIQPLRTVHSFRFVVPAEGTTAELIRSHGYEVDTLPFIEISRNMGRNLLYPFRLIGNAWRLRNIIKQHQIDIVQVNDLYNLVGIVAKRFVKVKVITHIRRMPESFPLRLYRFWVRKHKRRSDKILPVSKANARLFADTPKSEVFYDSLPPHEVNFVYDPSEKTPMRLLYLANFTIGKGQNHALVAFKQLIDTTQRTDISLHFEGSDFGLEKNKAYREELQQWAIAHGIDKHVTFGLGSDDIAKPISQADIMLNFSDSESLSRVSMEALYFGIPLIATNVGGTNEMVIDGWNGLLVERSDTLAMFNAMQRVLESSDLRQQFSTNGKVHVAQHFSSEVLTLQLEAIYASLK